MKTAVRLRPHTRFEGFDYTTRRTLSMTGREWHAYAKVDAFKLSRDRDNRDATSGRGHEVWGVR